MDAPTGRRIWSRLTEPATSSDDPDLRRRSRVLATLLLVLAPIVLLVSTVVPYLTDPAYDFFTPGVYVGLGIGSLLGLAWAFVASGRYSVGAGFTTAVTVGGAWAAILTNIDTPTGLQTVNFLAISALITTLLLPFRAQVVLACTNLAGVPLFAALHPAVTFPDVLTPFIFVLLATAFILVTGALREEDRRRLVSKSAELANQREFDAALLKTQSDLGLGVAIVDVARMRIVYVNDALSRVTGRGPRELLAGGVFDYLDPAEVPKLRERLAKRMRGEPAPDHYETAVVHRDGHRVPVEVAVKPTQGPGGPLLVSLVRDVSERARAEQERIVNLRKLAEAQHLARMGSWEWDMATDVVRWSDELYDIYGIPAGTPLTSRDFLARLQVDDRAAAQARIARALATGESFEADERILLPDGSERVLHSRGEVVRGSDGQPKGMVGVCQDVTAQKRAEAELEASRRRVAMSEKLSALGTLVAGVAHEINNPLAYMRSTTELSRDQAREMLQRTDLAPDQRTALEEVADNSEITLRGIDRIAHITSSLKRVARAGDGRRGSEDVNALADSVLTIASPRLRGGIRVHRDLRARRPAHASGSELSQVLLNLVFNAADAMATNTGGDLTVRTYDEEGFVVIEVEDTGVGIKAEDHHKIFIPFHTTKAQGTGLGLSVSYRIVEDHGGRLAFESRVGEGTRFRVRLPAVPEG